MSDTQTNKPDSTLLEDKVGVVLHRTLHVAEDVAHVCEHYDEGTYVFVPLEYSIGTYLRDKNLPMLDLRDYHARQDRARYMPFIYECVTKWYKDESLKDFTYEATELGSVYEWPLTLYLWRVLYYFHLFTHVLTAYGTPRAVVFVGLDDVVPDTAGPLASEEVRLIERVLSHVASSVHIPVTTVPAQAFVSLRGTSPQPNTQLLLSFLLRHISRGATRFLRIRPVRIFMSENWHNVSAFLPALRDTETVCMDRKEARTFLPLMWKLKIRFDRPSYFLLTSDRTTIQTHRTRNEMLWNEYQRSVGSKELFTFEGVSIYALVESALQKIVCTAPLRYLENRLGAQRLMSTYKINRVLVRASVSTQHHFLAIADAAKEAGIPCIELQHGLEYWGPHSLSTRKHAQAIATYGPSMSSYLPNVTSIPIGSPRFDAYRALVTNAIPASSRSRIVVLIPEIGIENFTSFDVAEFLQSVVRAARADTNCSWVFKFRPGMLSRPEYIHLRDTILADFETREYESLRDVLKDARMLIGHFSTAVLEAMLSNVPVILWTGHRVDTEMLTWQFGTLAGLGGVQYAKDTSALVHWSKATNEFLEAQIATAHSWMEEEFCFDGKSSERMRDLLRTGW